VAKAGPDQRVTRKTDRSLLAQQVGPLLTVLAEIEPGLDPETIVAAVRGRSAASASSASWSGNAGMTARAVANAASASANAGELGLPP
jgi:hypothetical protein